MTVLSHYVRFQAVFCPHREISVAGCLELGWGMRLELDVARATALWDAADERDLSIRTNTAAILWHGQPRGD